MPRARLRVPELPRAGSASTTATHPNHRTASASEPLHYSSFPPAAPVPVSPLVAQLRKDVRWASISQFLFTFGHAVGVTEEEADIDALEADLDSLVGELVPRLVVKLLYALTYDKKININTFESKLRAQYVLRDPTHNPFGNEEPVSRAWNQLGVGEKVGALYNCCEWQWVDPARFRALLNSEEDAVEWRIEPCGWDKAGNTYWLFDDNRLWVQHPAPTPPKAIRQPSGKTQKGNGKTAAAKRMGRRRGKGKGGPKEDEEMQAGLQRGNAVRGVSDDDASDAEQEHDHDLQLSLSQSGHALRKRALPPAAQTTTRSGRTSRKLMQHAESSPPAKKAKRSHPAPDAAPSGGRSTRASRRSGVVGDQWEPIPSEWLLPSTLGANGTRKRKAGQAPADADGDAESELSELSDSPGVGPEAEADGVEVESDLTSVSSWLSDLGDAVADADGDRGPEVVAPEEETDGQLGGDDANGRDLHPMDVDTSAVQQHPEGQSPVIASQLTALDVDGDVKMGEVPQIEAERSEMVVPAPAEAAREGDVEMAQETVAEGTAAEVLEQMPRTTPDLKPTSPKPETELTLPEKASETAIPPDEAEQKVNGADAKTVLEELSQEIREAQEEEVDPNDEVRAIIRKARNPDYLEWELVCACRYDWEVFPKQFEHSRNPDEKAFYRHLVNNILPGVLTAHREKEIRRAKEEAIRNRKRSSRLVVKELEREAQRKEEETARLVEERMQRVRDAEARKDAEESERITKEREREDRLREREERIREREERLRYRELEDINTKERSERDRELRLQRRDLGLSGGVSRQGSRQPSETPSKETRSRGRKRQSRSSPERWEVACEICHRQGWNIDEDRPIVSCELCERWQHIDCHDRFDKHHGRPPRKWANINFYCSDCARRLAGESARRVAEAPVNAKVMSPENNTIDSVVRRDAPESPTVHKSPRITIPAYANGRSPILRKAQPTFLSGNMSTQYAQHPTAQPPARPVRVQSVTEMPIAVSGPVMPSTIPATTHATVTGTPMPAPKSAKHVLVPSDDTPSAPDEEKPAQSPQMPIAVPHHPNPLNLAPLDSGAALNGDDAHMSQQAQPPPMTL